MNNMWVHPELRVTDSGFGSSRRPRTSGMFSSTQTAKSQFQRYAVPFFFLSTITLVPFFLAAIAFNMVGTSRIVQSLVSGTIPSITSHFHVGGKEAFLSKLTLGERKALAGQVNYISDLIKETGKSEESLGIARSIVQEASNADYDPLFIASVIHSESTFNRNARSSVGAVGLMQLIPDTAQFVAKLEGKMWLGSWRLHDPAYNLQLGIAYLKYLEDYFNGNRKYALIAYNWGPANLQDALKNRKPIPSSTIKYASNILERHSRWAAEFSERKQAIKFLDPDKILG